MQKLSKDTIYIEADDEITAVIDKVLSSKDKVVALVLPKRAQVFQSAVNMKLLKKSAEEVQKRIVLISSEEAIAAIAAVAGMYVAKTLNTKPEIPKAVKPRAVETTIGEDELEKVKPRAKLGSVAVAEAAGAASAESKLASPAVTGAGQEDTIDIDNTDTKKSKDEPTVDSEEPKKKKFKIPDFTSFQLKLGIGILLLLLLGGGWVYGFIIAPKATITINTDTSRTTVSYQFTAQADATELDQEKKVVPAKAVEITKESTAKIATTGQKNIGQKASGSVTVTNCSSAAYTVDSGDQFTSGGKSFAAVQSVSIPKSGYEFTLSGFECKNDGQRTVDVVAVEPGASYNLAASSYGMSGSPNNVSAKGTAMTGGTDEIVKIVSADDIKNATAQLKGSSSAEARTELQTQLTSQGMLALDQTLEEGAPAVKNTPAEGAEAEEVTVTQTVTYKLLGVDAEHLKTILDAELATQLEAESNTKNVRNNGFDSAALRVVNKVAFGQQIIELQTVATLGEKFDVDAIRTQVAGKKRGEIQSMLGNRPSVKSVDVSYSPAWITTTPKNANKITVTVNEVEN